uniref:Uncharacterized protein n=1 Tax=Chromera velia CCMP2878 TaxID=1169474 RepID=A0A0G4FZK0_9ALVE|eukprot:Cvel_3946.t1-p1 / transcript=Cvel_3946.t1 / gene=Cvel_3946 / organism=Chromera_velia_CCMP2878 / gene_product=hypothetical protein / transcript_product=hypothetical protein / location=Cvel_scaffold167:97320-99950(-) / protein_length=343 / sequence_SO=supercontig / SO=protein_coding / is_pseudo=false
MKRGAPEEVTDALGKLVKFDVDAVLSSNPSIEELRKAEEMLKSVRRSAALQGKDGGLEGLIEHIYSVFMATDDQLSRESVRKMLWNVKIKSITERPDAEYVNPLFQEPLDDSLKPSQTFYEVEIQVHGLDFKFSGSTCNAPDADGTQTNGDANGASEDLKNFVGAFSFEPFADVFLKPGGELEVDADTSYATLQTHAEKWAEVSEFNRDDPNSWIITARIIVVALMKLVDEKYEETHQHVTLENGSPIFHQILDFFEKHMYVWEPTVEDMAGAVGADEDDDDEDADDGEGDETAAGLEADEGEFEGEEDEEDEDAGEEFDEDAEDGVDGEGNEEGGDEDDAAE